MFYVYFENGVLYIDHEFIFYDIVGELVYIFVNGDLIARLKKDFVKITNKYGHIIYLGKNFKKVED